MKHDEARCERVLWWHVLDQAFNDALTSTSSQLAATSRAWFADDSTCVGSLRWVIYATGLDVKVADVRRRLLQGEKWSGIRYQRFVGRR